ncbi:DUF3987 domain-containing protein [Variovorax sp. LG9.2]|uniref:DUF3987 domain-containing protein n=1 Tax=Variovorax sp. LG9.2 TaxID=3048626 RepID=UPI002B231A25|nr:DUF3987 domain-containing protein [Variovorax sp. LG9.2]MEB0060043.1 DUF3987 domain-containing protein [Variovorax sp. LG9.2]
MTDHQQVKLRLDLGAALQHVRALTGSDAAPVTIASIRPSRKGETKATIETRRGDLASLWPWIERQQTEGFHVYVTVNETIGVRREKGDITRIRAVYTDDDNRRDAPLTWPIDPHLTVESSAGKFHYYWFVDEAPDGDAFEDLQRGIAAQYGTDKSATDIARVLRLAGTANLKPGAEGHLTRIVKQSDRQLYSRAEVFEAFPRLSDTISPHNLQSFDLAGAMSTIKTGGQGLHDALRGLAAHLAARGVTGEVIAPLLGGFAEQHSDGSQRYRERVAEIPELVRSAVAKFLQPNTLDASDPLDFFTTDSANAFGFVAADYPLVVSKFAADLSTRMGCDPLIPAWTMLVAAAGLLPDRFKLQVKAYDTTWLEAPRLWVALVGDPSSKKSPPMSAVLAAVEGHQAQKAREHDEAMSQWQTACAAAKKDKRAEPPAPVMPRVLAHDATIEALALVLHTTPGGMLVVHDELSGFFGAMDAYRGNGASKDNSFYLQAYNGAPFIVDRVNKAITVPHLSLSIVGGIQPDPMRSVAAKLKEDGLLQRFIVIPTRAAGSGVDVAADAMAAAGWADCVEVFARVRENGAWPEIYRLSPGAQHALDAGRRRLDELARDPSIDSRLAVALAKGEGQMARLVLTYHLIENRDGEGMFSEAEPDSLVTQTTAAKAVRVFFELVVPAQFDFYRRVVGETTHQRQCRRVAGYILAGSLETITDRSIYREALKELAEDERGRDAVMRSLELSGWVAPANEFKGRTTRWSVNPKVHSKFAARAISESARRNEIVAKIRDPLK